MKKLALISLLALAAAAPAAAKNPEWLKVCGDAGVCQTTTDRALLLSLMQNGGNGGPLGTPPRPAPYLVLTWRDEGTTWDVFYVPSAEAMAVTEPADRITHWWSAPDSNGLLAKVTAGVPLLPPPQLTSARVGAKNVQGGVQDYLRLFAAGSTDIAHENRGDWVPVDLVSKLPSPWTSSDRDLMFSPGSGLVERGTLQAKLPGDLADDVAAARPLSFADDAFAWLTLVVVFGAVALAVALALLLQRARRVEPRPTASAEV